MELINSKTVSQAKKSLNLFLCGFILLLALATAGYILSFYSDKLYVSVICGISAVIVCSAYFFLFLFSKLKHNRLYREILTGLSQKDRFVFKGLDGETEENGVPLVRVNAEYTSDDGETYIRTLYLVRALDRPRLKKETEYLFTTHRNVIIRIEELTN